MHADAVPFAEAPLVRTRSVPEAENGGARLLAGHRLKATSEGFEACINGISLGGLSLYYMCYGVPVTVLGAPLQDFVGVTVPLRGAIRVQQGRSVVVVEAERSAAVISPDEPMRLDWSADLEFFCFKFELAALRAFVQSVDPEIDLAKVASLEPKIAGRAGMTGVLGAASLIELASRQRGSGGRQGWPAALSGRLCEQAMMSLLVAQPGPWGGPTSPPMESRRAVRRAREYLETTAATSTITPSELAAAARVSLRTLQLGFRDELGTTPQAYLTDLRLRRTHAELVSASPRYGATVTAIATRWGFSNVGRFAEKYQAVYGERPSETLRRP